MLVIVIRQTDIPGRLQPKKDRPSFHLSHLLYTGQIAQILAQQRGASRVVPPPVKSSSRPILDPRKSSHALSRIVFRPSRHCPFDPFTPNLKFSVTVHGSRTKTLSEQTRSWEFSAHRFLTITSTFLNRCVPWPLRVIL